MLMPSPLVSPLKCPASHFQNLQAQMVTPTQKEVGSPQVETISPSFVFFQNCAPVCYSCLNIPYLSSKGILYLYTVQIFVELMKELLSKYLRVKQSTMHHNLETCADVPRKEKSTVLSSKKFFETYFLNFFFFLERERECERVQEGQRERIFKQTPC